MRLQIQAGAIRHNGLKVSGLTVTTDNLYMENANSKSKESGVTAFRND